MASAPTYPGVYIREIPSGVHTITGVATSITAFIGRAARGPVDDPTVVNSFADYERQFGGLSLLSTMSFAVRDFFLNGGSQAIIVRVHNGATPATITLPSGSPPGSLALEAANPGAWGNNLNAVVDYSTRNPNDPALFNLTITEVDSATGQTLNGEVFLNVSVNASDPRFVPRVLEQSSNLVRVSTGSVLPAGRPLATVGPASPPTSPPSNKPKPVPATTGSGGDGNDVADAQFTGTGLDTAKKGLFALEKADLFNLLCIAPFSFSADVSLAVVGAAATYCEDRRAMLLVDPPSGWTSKAIAVNQFSDPNTDFVGTRSKNAALFFPRINETNPLHDNQLETFAPCGAVAGVFARTDGQRGVWKAPAGQDAVLVGVPELSVSLTDAENGELNPLGVNCLRAFPIVGRVVWGARTLQGANQLASEWKYVPVRRTALFLEESLYRGTKWVVFEPNDESLWAQIRLNVGAFMQGLFRQGAFQGKTARDAYLVKCDSETTTQNDINNGIVNILVGFAPLKPAEFVIIQIQQLAGQIQV